jgi:hypothetical protein
LASPLCLPSLLRFSHLPHWSDQGSALSNLLLYLIQLFRALLTHCPDDGGSKFLWKICQYVWDYTEKHPERQPPLSKLLHPLTKFLHNVKRLLILQMIYWYK